MREIRVPKVGMSTIEVEIVDLLVEPGQVVGAGDAIMTIAADKIDLEVEAPEAGTIVSVLVSSGDVCEVGDVVAWMDPR